MRGRERKVISVRQMDLKSFLVDLDFPPRPIIPKPTPEGQGMKSDKFKTDELEVFLS